VSPGALRPLDRCGCCEPAAPATPETIDNRPGLRQVAYRVGTYASFREAMIEAIPRSRALRDWTTRSQDDYGIALLQMWAYVADILTFYQERIANEAFLRTALFRESIVRLAALLGYRPARGVAAATEIEFTVEPDRSVSIPAGFLVQSVPAQDERPQKFETTESVTVLASLNRRPAYGPPEGYNPFARGRTEGWLLAADADALAAQLGDQLVLFFETRDGTVEEKSISAVEPQAMRTRLGWAPTVQSQRRTLRNTRAFRYSRKLRLFGHDAPPEFTYAYVASDGTYQTVEISEADQKASGTPQEIEGKTIDYLFEAPPGTKLVLDAEYPDLKAGTQVLIPIDRVSGAPLTSLGAKPFYRLVKIDGLFRSTFLTASESERAAKLQAGYEDEGLVGFVQTGGSGDHLYTTSGIERDRVQDESGYVFESTAAYAFLAPREGTTPLYRLFNTKNHHHFYTSDETERATALASPDYVDEGTPCHVFRDEERDAVPLYRLLNSTTRDYLLTASVTERDYKHSHGYTGEPSPGWTVVGYVYATQAGGAAPLYRLQQPFKPAGTKALVRAHNPTTDVYMWTTDASTIPGTGGWVIDARPLTEVEYVFDTQQLGTTQVLQYHESDGYDFFYTTSRVDAARTIPYDYSEDKSAKAGYVYASDAILTTITATRSVQAKKGPRSGTATEITLGDPIPPIPDLRTLTVYEVDDEARFWNRRYPPRLSGASVYIPETELAGIDPRRKLLLGDGAPEAEGAEVIEALAVDTDDDGVLDHLEISFTPGLPRKLDAGTAFLAANVAGATHGETVPPERLGRGDASVAFQKHALAKSPVTYVPHAGAPHGAESTLDVRVDGVRWHEQETFFGSGSEERVYTTDADESGALTVVFGDGQTGARPRTGSELVARYRKGLGREGNVRAGGVTNLLQRPTGLEAVTNPIPAAGGADAESASEARRNAPVTVKTFGRIVSLRDFEDAAREHSGIAKARAAWRWAGSEEAVRLTVAGERGEHLTPVTRANLVADLDSRRDPNRKLGVIDYTAVPIVIELAVKVDPDYDPSAVLRAVADAVALFLDFDSVEFGEAIHLSDVFTAVQDVPGVVAADVDRLQYKHAADVTSHAVGPQPVAPHLWIFPDELPVLATSTDVLVKVAP